MEIKKLLKIKQEEEEEDDGNDFNKHHMNFFNEYVKYAFQIINRKEIDSKVKDETKFIIDKIFYHFTLANQLQINSEGPNSPTLKETSNHPQKPERRKRKNSFDRVPNMV